MKLYILSLNCGSSSLKFNLFEKTKEDRLISRLNGIVEEVGNKERSLLRYTLNGSRHKKPVPVESHKALILLFKRIGEA